MPIMDHTYEAPRTRGSDDGGKSPMNLNQNLNETMEEIPLRKSMKLDNHKTLNASDSKIDIGFTKQNSIPLKNEKDTIDDVEPLILLTEGHKQPANLPKPNMDFLQMKKMMVFESLDDFNPTVKSSLNSNIAKQQMQIDPNTFYRPVPGDRIDE